MTSLRDQLKASPVLPILLQSFDETVNAELHAFKQYIKENRSNINKLQEVFKTKIEELNKANPEYIYEIWEHHSDEDYLYIDFYPSKFHASTFLTIFSIFEGHLKSYCNLINKYKGSGQSINFGRDILSNCRSFLVDNMGFTEKELCWFEWTRFNTVRNSIVHSNSSIDREIGENIALMDIIKKSPLFSINTEKRTFIIKDDQYLLDFCIKLDSLFETLVKKYYKGPLLRK